MKNLLVGNLPGPKDKRGGGKTNIRSEGLNGWGLKFKSEEPEHFSLAPGKKTAHRVRYGWTWQIPYCRMIEKGQKLMT
jgi:hypothetical protein